MPQLPTEIEQALEIARKTRTELTSGKMSLENGIYRLYTVAQILGRDEDKEWAESELMGYGGDYPPYRSSVSRMFVGEYDIQIRSLIRGAVSVTPCALSITQVEKMLDPKFPKTNTVLRDEDIDSMTSSQKKDIASLSRIVWRFHNKGLLQVATGAKFELIKRTNVIIEEIMYGKIPEGIFKKIPGQGQRFTSQLQPRSCKPTQDGL